MSMRRISMVLGMALVVGACTYGEALEFVEGAGGGTDLTDPAQPPAVRAACSVEEAEDKEQTAREAIQASLDPNAGIGTKIGHVDDAITARPRDPRNHIYRAWWNRLAGDTAASNDDLALAATLTLIHATNDEEAERRFDEHFLDATLAILRTYPTDSDTYARMRGSYCTTLLLYIGAYSESLPGSAYLDFTADTDLC